MNITLLKPFVALIPACMLFVGAWVLFSKTKATWTFLQLLGSGCLIVVVVTHIAEAFHLFPAMRWGFENSVGHYVDFVSAALTVILFPLGYLLFALSIEQRQA
jgi:hypothetical protein